MQDKFNFILLYVTCDTLVKDIFVCWKGLGGATPDCAQILCTGITLTGTWGIIWDSQDLNPGRSFTRPIPYGIVRA